MARLVAARAAELTDAYRTGMAADGQTAADTEVRVLLYAKPAKLVDPGVVRLIQDALRWVDRPGLSVQFRPDEPTPTVSTPTPQRPLGTEGVSSGVDPEQHLLHDVLRGGIVTDAPPHDATDEREQFGQEPLVGFGVPLLGGRHPPSPALRSLFSLFRLAGQALVEPVQGFGEDLGQLIEHGAVAGEHLLIFVYGSQYAGGGTILTVCATSVLAISIGVASKFLLIGMGIAVL